MEIKTRELLSSNLEVYEVWHASHDCNLNFHDRYLKVIAANNIFDCSITKHNI